MRLFGLVAPAAFLKLWIKKDRLLVEMADKSGIDLAAFDGLKDRSHWLRRLEPAQVEMDGVGRPPHAGSVRRRRVIVVHGKLPLALPGYKPVPKCQIMR
jgi:hypothetical protein